MNRKKILKLILLVVFFALLGGYWIFNFKESQKNQASADDKKIEILDSLANAVHDNKMTLEGKIKILDSLRASK